MKIQSTFDLIKPMPPFKEELRKANREGKKSQTRRVMDPQPILPGVWKGLHWGSESHFRKGTFQLCKYGKVGNLVYMREPLQRGPGDRAYYADDFTEVKNIMTGESIWWEWKVKTLSQLYMPKVAARSFFKYEFIRVERVQEITRDDAKAEGVSNVWSWDSSKDKHLFKRALLNPYIANYSVLWDEINAKRGFGWDANPWVWVLGYKPVIFFAPGTVGSGIAGAEPDLLIFDDFLGGGNGKN